MEDIDVFDNVSTTAFMINLLVPPSKHLENIRNNFLTPRTVQAHCTFLRTAFSEITYCLSNAYFLTKPFPLREALNHQVKVGLGTDIAGGYGLDKMTSMRQAVALPRTREEGRVMMSEASAGEKRLSIDWKESLFLATRGGSIALGLEGMFKIGAPFDAQESRCQLGANYEWK